MNWCRFRHSAKQMASTHRMESNGMLCSAFAKHEYHSPWTPSAFYLITLTSQMIVIKHDDFQFACSMFMMRKRHFRLFTTIKENSCTLFRRICPCIHTHIYMYSHCAHYLNACVSHKSLKWMRFFSSKTLFRW